jgi:CRISPR-associated endonuclease/helicase Cas3
MGEATISIPSPSMGEGRVGVDRCASVTLICGATSTGSLYEPAGVIKAGMTGTKNMKLAHRQTDSFFHYWGKADPNYPREPQWHPLVYHCLDVAAVAGAWWDTSTVIRRTFLAAFEQPDSATCRLRAWVLFFVALHDLGKFDVRFQLKAEDALRQAWPELDFKDTDPYAARGFDHGLWGYSWAIRECPDWVGTETDPDIRDDWKALFAAVTGHHGDLPQSPDTPTEYAEAHVMEHDRRARREVVLKFTELFLACEGLRLSAAPPRCTPASQALVAGFCAVCDWIGSNVDAFPYRTLATNAHATDYFDERVRDIQSENLLHRSGLIAKANSYSGVDRLLGENESPRGVQTLVDKLSLAPGLTLIEAPTGSGKTEAALAYAWRLLDAGLADSIVFALPTQATANAMLIRAEAFAVRAFGRERRVRIETSLAARHRYSAPGG